MMHGNTLKTLKTRALMIRYQSQKQLSLAEFGIPFDTSLDENNRWVKLGRVIPWDEFADGYYQSLSITEGRPAKDARLVIGAVIIKHKLCLSDEETVCQIQENPYLQYFVGLKDFQNNQPFSSSLFVEVRRRMGQDVFEIFHQAIVDKVSEGKSSQVKKSPRNDESPPNNSPGSPPASESDQQVQTPTHKGKLILDATVAEQAIRFPTDLSLLSEARELTEKIIDHLYPHTNEPKKPRTYRQVARRRFLAVVKQRRPRKNVLRKGIRQQLQYLRRNIAHIEQLLDHWDMGKRISLPRWLMHRYWVIQHLYQQQKGMYDSKQKRCDNRIVSISQPHVRPIIRGKLNKPVEFGAKLSASLNGDGLAFVDHLSWDAFHEGGDLEMQVEAYHKRNGYYPEKVLGDPIYGTRDNRRYLDKKDIHFAGKPLGRPRKVTDENKEELKQLKKQRREDYLQRIPIEGKFGQGKNGYQLGYIRAKRADTSGAWINSIFLVMNLLVLLEVFIDYNKPKALGYLNCLLVSIASANEWQKHLACRLFSVVSPCRVSTY